MVDEYDTASSPVHRIRCICVVPAGHIVNRLLQTGTGAYAIWSQLEDQPGYIFFQKLYVSVYWELPLFDLVQEQLGHYSHLHCIMLVFLLHGWVRLGCLSI